jgi:(R,R)-butanediol dehydrogenase / meso-butanediol dehydrogenase / diacetyl reductase
MSDLRAAFYEGNQSIRVGDCVPVAPSPSEVQIRVAYCGICGTDLHIFHGAMDHRVHFPQVLGHEMSGVITAVGSEVEGLRPANTLLCDLSTRVAVVRPAGRATYISVRT